MFHNYAIDCHIYVLLNLNINVLIPSLFKNLIFMNFMLELKKENCFNFASEIITYYNKAI